MMAPQDDDITYMISKLFVDNIFGGARGVMVIVVGNGHGDTSSNPGRALIPLGKV